ncbi:MAG: hypothetical protein QOH93_2352 [Chloroflexia bacterium]|jgi:hypothetical protein|nr:hypothetical protein [Chloroflexia bacterium]
MDDTLGGDGTESRPSVLDNASETQLLELERHYAEGDRDAWGALTGSYGWSEQQAEEVWQWFGERSQPGDAFNQ